jgi:hypothetical protein
MGRLLKPFQSAYWLILPFLLYFVPRLYWEKQFSRTKVLDISSIMSILHIYERNDEYVLQTRHFLTSINYDDRDLGAILLRHATRSKHQDTYFDLLLC